MPGIGGGTSNIVSYSIAKNQSRHPERFGTGIIDGVVASETANNATIGGSHDPSSDARNSWRYGQPLCYWEAS